MSERSGLISSLMMRIRNELGIEPPEPISIGEVRALLGIFQRWNLVGGARVLAPS